MISHFFIDRPIFASVLSIVFVLAGLVAVLTLPVAQYPEVAPPTVQVTAFYPGANSLTVRDTVAAPIEEQVSGVEGMMYMSSQCTNDGSYSLTVTFKIGTDSDMAQVLVQNRVSLALPVIPNVVQREGLVVKKMSPNRLMIVNLISPGNEYSDLFLSNYATIEIADELGRLDGVAGVTFLGERNYSMRAWLDPQKMAALGISTGDVVTAITEQNAQVAAGAIGQPPVPKGQQFQLTINTLGRLVDPEQFADIIVKVGTSDTSADLGGASGWFGSQAATATATTSPTPQPGGAPPPEDVAALTTSPSVVRLRDVARVELGAQQYEQTATLDGEPSVALSIYQLPGTNALQTADRVYAKMEELKKRFPEGVQYRIVYDTTPFIRQSVREVFLTFRDAVILVALVVLVFLQNWRAALIPMIAVPVAIIGTFAVMAAIGFSLNNISLFGLVLAIGIVVDDAIVVVENIERWLEKGEQPREAARKAMTEVTGPVIAIALVLCAVFVPCAFLGGITGQFFRQFAVTIAVSTVISAFNSLTLSPALGALLLKPRGATRDPLTWLLDVTLGWFFRLFNWTFGAATNLYTRAVGGVLRVSLVALLVYGGLLALTYFEFQRVPTGFVPQQDKGYLLVDVQLPDAASVERTQQTLQRIEKIVHEIPGVEHTVAVSGQSLVLNANAPNIGSMYVILKNFDERRAADRSADAVVEAIRQRCRKEVRWASVAVFGAPPIEGLGTTGGFRMIIQDRGNAGLDELQRVGDRVAVEANRLPQLRNVNNNSRANTPWLYLEIDRTKALVLGVPLSEVFNALQYYLGSFYVNNFNEFGRTWQVIIQADERYRDNVRDIKLLTVRNSQGQTVQLGTLLTPRSSSGPLMIMRYNLYSATAITGDPGPGVSSGQAVEYMEQVAGRELPHSMAYEWTELTYLQLQAGNTALYVFALAVVFVFLVLAAQYESWKLPLAVILVVPMCLLCSVAGVDAAGMDITVFTQIGFVVLVGLASKNAILIVEFAKAQREAGVPPREAALEASRLRLRPILMTSFAFIFGVVPLVFASGAGAEMRRTLGLAVFAGMIGVTAFGIFLTPVFFYVLQWFGGQKPREGEPGAAPLTATEPASRPQGIQQAPSH
jgi:hydrophobe/amphiphile efflux-1 (HAE1) family protein